MPLRHKAVSCICILALSSCAAGHKSIPIADNNSDSNYHYSFNSACRCIISKDVPAGMNYVSIGSYETDPDIHMLHGYYKNVSGRKQDTFFLVNNDPKVFWCQPCVTIVPKTNYLLYFEGKPEAGSVMVKLSQNSKGKIKLIK